MPRKVPARVRQETPAKAAESEPKPRSTPARENACIPAAMSAREVLEPLGWQMAGKAWIDEAGMGHATLTATRGSEMLVITWENGALINQHYSLWDVTKPSNNGKPAGKLGFDPDETSDVELVRRISGMRVTWWNRIARDTETAVISARVQIEHGYSPTGDEVPGERVIKFIDHEGSGFRAFRVDALMEIG